MKVTIEIPEIYIRGLAMGILMNDPSLGPNFVEKVVNTPEIELSQDKLQTTKKEFDQLQSAIGLMVLAQIANESKELTNG